tara:strand:+ start:6447 stop:7646 length:1200 start_codon:yes stop_codon:yes gene_type:complete
MFEGLLRRKKKQPEVPEFESFKNVHVTSSMPEASVVAGGGPRSRIDPVEAAMKSIRGLEDEEVPVVSKKERQEPHANMMAPPVAQKPRTVSLEPSTDSVPRVKTMPTIDAEISIPQKEQVPSLEVVSEIKEAVETAAADAPESIKRQSESETVSLQERLERAHASEEAIEATVDAIQEVASTHTDIYGVKREAAPETPQMETVVIHKGGTSQKEGAHRVTKENKMSNTEELVSREKASFEDRINDLVDTVSDKERLKKQLIAEFYKKTIADLVGERTAIKEPQKESVTEAEEGDVEKTLRAIRAIVEQLKETVDPQVVEVVDASSRKLQESGTQKQTQKILTGFALHAVEAPTKVARTGVIAGALGGLAVGTAAATAAATGLAIVSGGRSITLTPKKVV